jgi:glutamyl-tRNA synthetase
LGRMGWSMPDEREQFTLAEMIAHFDIARVSLGGPIFDVEKLTWLNGLWIRDLSPAALLDKILAWRGNRAQLEKITAAIQPRINTLSDAADWAGFFFNGTLTASTLSEQMQIKLREFMPPFFIAIAGSSSSTPVMESMAILGADLTYARLRQAIEILGGVSKKETSEWQKLDIALTQPKNLSDVVENTAQTIDSGSLNP